MKSTLILLMLVNAITKAQGKPLRSASKMLEAEEQKRSQYESVQRVVKNPTLASGLTSGAKSINQTVDTLMETIFYSIMDQTFDIEFTADLDLETNFSRDVNETSVGTYIVTDQFRIGPKYQKEINRIGNIPINLGSDGYLFVRNIYHRTDAIRAFERRNLPLWRTLFNHWFGILPILANILPPSFNQEELYDPLTYLQTPLMIPSNSEQASKIPIGSIRQYGISGGINLSFDPLRKSLLRLQDEINSENLNVDVPFTVFKTGNHTISVLRKSQYIYWVLVTDGRTQGVKVESILATSFKFFTKLIPQWSGVKAPFSPIDVLLSKAKLSSIEQLYTFDFRYPVARKAYEKATRGDLAPAFRAHSRGVKQKSDFTGVSFEFNKVTFAHQEGTQTERNFFVQQLKHANQITSSEIEIHDPSGETNILEAEQVWENLDWDVLVGAENIKMNNRVEMKVKKASSYSKKNPRYLFDPYMKSPINIFSSLNITDRFTDAREFQKVINLMRYYLALPLREVPTIPVYSHQRQLQYKLDNTLMNPMDDIRNIKVSPTYLGKMSLNAHISFPSQYLKHMSQKKPFQIRRAMALAYGMDANYWAQKQLRERWSWMFQYMGWVTVQPLKLINFKVPDFEFINETKRTVDAFEMLNQAVTPMEHLNAFSTLFDSAYPVQLIRALCLLGDYRRLPRLLSFSTQAKHKPLDTGDMKRAKNTFAKLNHKVIKSRTKFPKSFTFKTIDRKLAAFDPNNFIDNRARPQLSKIRITPIKRKDIEYLVDLNLNLTNSERKTVYVYIKLEQSGSVNFGRFVLFDQVIKLSTTSNRSTKRANARTSFYINGKSSPFGSPLSDLIIGLGGTFNIHISLSEDTQTWSDSRFIQTELGESGVKIL
ncbi:hypothetical protein [Pseudobacteriovorax antillogorgiicola]|uniref:Uncharacterized protein n=1 Tax=Pseudobacteriovorax antillogorgiicola TaxID=1513793 RepID=A0A1Y6B5P1_9BACT|nr:hypothetical protein [Pseudobacteriovorax antillogorgiicola]TCS59358.1 hypothetical protein EDD56_101268 [Pseudobacteriovorax antillogorgiicola]SME89017.1 hypothetical protein SAMN06296036_101218 [Pseudobacteriovorax antillogorgiicola]